MSGHTGQASRRATKLRIYNERKAKGICTCCGINKARPEMMTCQNCCDKRKGVKRKKGVWASDEKTN